MEKLNFNEFCEKVREGVESQLPEKMKVELTEVKKNNGVILTGMSIGEKAGRIAANLYLNGAYEDYRNGKIGIDEIVDRATDMAFDATHHVPFKKEDVDKALTHDGAHGHIVGQLIGVEENKEFLKEVPHEMVNDELALIFREKISNDASLIIRNEHLSSIQMDLEELKAEARNNEMTEYKFADIVDWMPAMRNMPGGMMFIGGNVNMDNGGISNFGASCVTDPFFMEEVREVLGEDCGVGNYVILPSSVHECIFIPYNENLEVSALSELIREVNFSTVAREEQLGSKPFMYDYDTGKVITMEEGLEKISRAHEHDNSHDLVIPDIDIA